MARKTLIVKAKRVPKYSTRKYYRCLECGRSRFVLEIDGGRICRIHFREWVYQGLLAGWRKASW